MSVLNECIIILREWMNENRLKLNVNKTKVIITGSRQQLRKCDKQSISIILKYPLTTPWSKQVEAKCRTTMFNLLRIKSIRHLLTEDAFHTLVRCLVLLHLDYCNAVYAGRLNTDIDKLQRVQNSAGKLVKNCERYDSALVAKFCTGCHIILNINAHEI